MDRTVLLARCPYCDVAPCRCAVADPDPATEEEEGDRHDWAPWWGASAANA
jgi:hypothetical protein